MAKLSNDELLDVFKEMTLLELSEFVKQFEETFDVTAAAPVAAAPAAAAGGAAEEVEEQTQFDVVLDDPGEKKINVIKEIRTITGLGLKEAKDLVEGAPKTIKDGVNKDEAQKIKKVLEENGAQVDIT